MNEISERFTDEKSCSVDLPKGWKRISLEDHVFIAARIGWRGLKKSEYTKEGPLFLAVKDIREDGTIDWDGITDHLNEFRYSESLEIQLKDHDILVTKDGTIGKIGFVEDAPSEATVNSSILVVRPCQGILPKYLFYYFRGPEFQEIVEEKVTGTAVQHLFQHDIKRFQLNVPPFAEQRRIVAKIEELFQELRTAREALQKAPTLIKQFRQSVLAVAFRGKLTKRDPNDESAERLAEGIKTKRWTKETGCGKLGQSGGFPFKLPQKWVWTTIGGAFEVAVGGTPSRKEQNYWNGTIPWVSSGEVAFCRIQSTREKITEEGVENSSAKIRPVGTVLLAMIGEGKTRGQAAILDRAASTNQNIAAVLCSKTSVPSEYVYWWLYYRYNETRLVGEGGAQPALNASRVRLIPIPLAPLDEMKRIALKVGKLFAYADMINEDVGIAQDRTDMLERSILAKAFQGRLVSQDPNDEPASILLERIKPRLSISAR